MGNSSSSSSHPRQQAQTRQSQQSRQQKKNTSSLYQKVMTPLHTFLDTSQITANRLENDDWFVFCLTNHELWNECFQTTEFTLIL